MKSVPIRTTKDHFDKHSTSNILIKKVEDLLSGGDLIEPVHRHDFDFVLALEKGNGKHAIDFVSYDIPDYSVFFVRAGQVHELFLKQGCTGFLLEFSSNFLHSKHKKTKLLLRSLGQQNLYAIDQSSFQRITSCLKTILEESKSKREEYIDVIKANLQLALIELYRCRENKYPDLDAKEKYRQEQLGLLLELVETNVTTHKQVNEYAEMMHLTTYQLNNITKTLIGKTCSEVINEQILLEAKRLLMVTSNQVNEIAYQLGYEDASYFIRFFKKHTGFSPASFVENFK